MKPERWAVLLAAACLVYPVHAQVVRGVLVSSLTNQPLPYGTIVLGDAPRGRFTDATGQFVLSPGSHRIRAEALGFVPLDTTVADNAGSSKLVLRLDPLVVAAQAPSASVDRCTTPGFRDDPRTHPVLALLRENVDRYEILVDQYPFRYQWEVRRDVSLSTTAREDADDLTGRSRGSDSTLSVDTTSFDSPDRVPYAVGSVVHRERSGPVMSPPTLRDLADPAFQASHCFAFTGTSKGELRIDFRPADSIHVPDVTGSVYLDATRYIVRRAVFELTHPDVFNDALTSLTITTKFQEVAPLVPMVATTYAEQQIHPGIAMWRQSAEGHGPRTSFVHFAHPDQDHRMIDDGRMLSHTFVGDTVGSLIAAGAPGTPAPNTTVSISLACAMPPSFETADVALYATLNGPATNASAMAALTALRPLFRLPTDLTLSVYSASTTRKVAQTLDDEVAFSVDASGHLAQTVLAATSLSPSADSALVAAVRNAGAAGAFARLRPGQYTLSLSPATPSPTARSLIFARIETSILPLARAAALDADSTQPALPVGGTFQFVVDEHGRAMPTTLRVLTSSPDAVTATAMQALPGLRFKPALAGECPIKQEVTLTGARSTKS